MPRSAAPARGGLIAPALFVGGVLALVLAVDVRSLRKVRVALTTESTGARFTIARRPVIFEWEPVDSVFVRDVKSVASLSTGAVVTGLDGDVRFASTGSSGAQSAVTLAALSLPAGTTVALQAREQPNEWDIDVELPPGHHPALRVSFAGPFSIANHSMRHEGQSRASFDIVPARQTITLILPSPPRELLARVDVSHVAFVKTAGARTERGDAREDQPSLVNGAIQFPGVAGESRVGGGGVTALLLEAPEGTLSGVRVTDRLIAARFDGAVTNVIENGASIVPSFARRIEASAVASWSRLLVAVAAAITTIAAGVKSYSQLRNKLRARRRWTWLFARLPSWFSRFSPTPVRRRRS
jgi:hypothetical protein